MNIKVKLVFAYLIFAALIPIYGLYFITFIHESAHSSSAYMAGLYARYLLPLTLSTIAIVGILKRNLKIIKFSFIPLSILAGINFSVDFFQEAGFNPIAIVISIATWSAWYYLLYQPLRKHCA